MKAILIFTAGGLLLAGCASMETGQVTRTGGTTIYGLNDQPQTSVAGEGSLMPGAYDSRTLMTGQFTGRERTNDQVGQRPTLPRESDARELARDSQAEMGQGAGTLGQSGIVPDGPVTGETLMEEPVLPDASAHAVVIPPGSEFGQQEEAAGAPAEPERGQARSDEQPER